MIKNIDICTKKIISALNMSKNIDMCINFKKNTDPRIYFGDQTEFYNTLGIGQTQLENKPIILPL